MENLKNILYVNLDKSSSIPKFLNKLEGFKATIVDTLQEAVAKIDEIQFDLVIADFQPNVNWLKQVKKLNHTRPVIIITDSKKRSNQLKTTLKHCLFKENLTFDRFKKYVITTVGKKEVKTKTNMVEKIAEIAFRIEK